MYVDINTNGKQYSKYVPMGYKSIGAISDDNYDNPGMLIYGGINSVYKKCNQGSMLDLDQNEVALAIAAAINRDARPTINDIVTETNTKKLRSVNMDERTYVILKNYGGGNLSAGVRNAALLIERGQS